MYVPTPPPPPRRRSPARSCHSPLSHSQPQPPLGKHDDYRSCQHITLSDLVITRCSTIGSVSVAVRRPTQPAIFFVDDDFDEIEISRRPIARYLVVVDDGGAKLAVPLSVISIIRSLSLPYQVGVALLFKKDKDFDASGRCEGFFSRVLSSSDFRRPFSEEFLLEDDGS
ncbi:unnamed protein product [Heligmosomoides polygyrus]|uniref:Velvet domain-containing protein n=1 Tax=Heligmosomoides polygyrus TaxID=6339 RepID=A0A183F2B3_HELPZ|nr:unnamed protein product [Heligmosomoides polygyrus]